MTRWIPRFGVLAFVLAFVLCGLAMAPVSQAVQRHQISDRYDFRLGGGADGVTTINATYCGELAENGTIYMGPIALTTPNPGIDAAGCDTLTNATEATADSPVFVGSTSRPMKMLCTTAGVLGAGESIVVTLRAAVASVAAGGGDFGCTIGVAALSCEATVEGETFIPANTPTAIRAVMSSNNADGDDLICVVYYQVD